MKLTPAVALMILQLLEAGVCSATDFDNPQNGKTLTVVVCPIEQSTSNPVIPQQIPVDPKKRT